jgi:hypothetical protein
MKSLPLVIIAFLILLSSCSSSKVSTEDVKALQNQWIHSHEEDQNQVRTYRTSDFEFPPSRGREKFNLMADGELEYVPLSPNDQPVKYKGKWEIQGTTLIFEYNQKSIEYKILEISNKTLKLKSK